MDFDEKFRCFVQEQQNGAKGMRYELLQREMVGEKKLFKEVLWPVFQSFEGFVLEYEIVNSAGVTMYIDAFYEPFGIAFESEGYVVHAEKITRDRFDFEKKRIRSISAHGYYYFPFSWDEMDKKAEICRTSVYELLGRFGSSDQVKLSIYEREIINRAKLLGRPLKVSDVSQWLCKSGKSARIVINTLLDKQILLPLHENRSRNHYFKINSTKLKRL